MSVTYPLCKPVILQNIQRSAEERSTLCNMNITLAPMIRQGILAVNFQNGDIYHPISRSCRNAFHAVHHQWLKYVEMVTKCTVEVDRGLMDPNHLRLYTSMVAYLKDVMFAFKEETEASGNSCPTGIQRSARLDFHYALALSGRSYTESNRRKMEKKFNVKWEDFLSGVNIPELAKLTDPSAFHALLCGDDENFCGFVAIKHTDASLTMIDRYIENSVKAWCASKGLASHGKALPESGPSGLGKAKQMTNGPSEKRDSQRHIHSTRSATRSEKLIIKLPAISKMKDNKPKDPVKRTRDSMKKKEATEVEIEEIPSISMSSRGKVQPTNEHTSIAQQTVERFRSLIISSEVVEVRQDIMGASSPKERVEEEVQTHVKKDEQQMSKTRVVKGGRKRQSKPSIVRSPSLPPESEEGCEVNDSMNASVEITSKAVPEKAIQADEEEMDRDSDFVQSMREYSWPSEDELLRQAKDFADGTTVTNNLLIWLMKRYRCVSNIPFIKKFEGQLISQSPEETSFADRDLYLEALGLERFYVALTNMDNSPHHLVHLFHALGTAALQTNLLSESSPTVTAVEPLPWLRSRLSDDGDNVAPLDADVELVNHDGAIGQDGPNTATDIMVVDEDANCTARGDAQGVQSDSLLISPNPGAINDIEIVCEDPEATRKRKRVESRSTSTHKAEEGRRPNKRFKRAMELASIGQHSTVARPKPGPASIVISRQKATGPLYMSSGEIEISAAPLPSAPQPIQDESGTDGKKDDLHGESDATVEVSMSSRAVRGISNSAEADDLPLVAKAQSLGMEEGGSLCGPTDAETKAWFEKWM